MGDEVPSETYQSWHKVVSLIFLMHGINLIVNDSYMQVSFFTSLIFHQNVNCHKMVPKAFPSCAVPHVLRNILVNEFHSIYS